MGGIFIAYDNGFGNKHARAFSTLRAAFRV
jgi:hypothetical protein